MSGVGNLFHQAGLSEAQAARDCLVGLMGARLADKLIAQLYAAGFEITPIPVEPGYAETKKT